MSHSKREREETYPALMDAGVGTKLILPFAATVIIALVLVASYVLIPGAPRWILLLMLVPLLGFITLGMYLMSLAPVRYELREEGVRVIRPAMLGLNGKRVTLLPWEGIKKVEPVPVSILQRVKGPFWGAYGFTGLREVPGHGQVRLAMRTLHHAVLLRTEGQGLWMLSAGSSDFRRALLARITPEQDPGFDERTAALLKNFQAN